MRRIGLGSQVLRFDGSWIGVILLTPGVPLSSRHSAEACNTWMPVRPSVAWNLMYACYRATAPEAP